MPSTHCCCQWQGTRDGGSARGRAGPGASLDSLAVDSQTGHCAHPTSFWIRLTSLTIMHGDGRRRQHAAAGREPPSQFAEVSPGDILGERRVQFRLADGDRVGRRRGGHDRRGRAAAAGVKWARLTAAPPPHSDASSRAICCGDQVATESALGQFLRSMDSAGACGFNARSH